jgi:hypothetical protein
MLRKQSGLLISPVLALGALALAGSPAGAADGASYQANLQAANGSSAMGSVTISVTGNQATVTENVSGLAATFNGQPYPHSQHIHIGGTGKCATPAADANGDGVVSSTEGTPIVGKIGTTLSTSGDTSAAAAMNLSAAPAGASYTYRRTFTLNPETAASLRSGTAVVEVHGLDPATLSPAAQKEPSDMMPSLPLAATSPAACGVLVASQMSHVPGGAPGTGVVSANAAADSTNAPDAGMIAVGTVLVLAAGGTFLLRRRISTDV